MTLARLVMLLQAGAAPIPFTEGVWQTFGLLAAFVGQLCVTTAYLVYRDRGDASMRGALVAALERMQGNASSSLKEAQESAARAQVESARIYASAQGETDKVLREAMTMMGRFAGAIDRVGWQPAPQRRADGNGS